MGSHFNSFLLLLQNSLKEKEDKNKKVLIQAREKLQKLTGILTVKRKDWQFQAKISSNLLRNVSAVCE